jgi:hypothetical protein
MYFSYDHLQLRYEPFPIGLAKPLMDERTYRSMVDAYPPLELFQYIPKVGNKYCLSQKFHADQYHDFIRQHAVWRDFHAWIKSDAFPAEVMQVLKERFVDLGFLALGAADERQQQQRHAQDADHQHRGGCVSRAPRQPDGAVSARA